MVCASLQSSIDRNSGEILQFFSTSYVQIMCLLRLAGTSHHSQK